MTTTVLVRETRTGTATKLNRYLLVTAVASPANLALYALLLAWTAWPAVAANLVAATCVTVPTYFANRQWVWGLTRPHSFRADVMPYWVMTVINVAVSSAVIAWLEHLGARDTLLVGSTLGSYTGIWLARFFFLDRILFARGQ